MNSSDPRLDWIRQYAEGTASAETTARLEQALREDAALRKVFLAYVNVDIALADLAILSDQAQEDAKAVRVPTISLTGGWAGIWGWTIDAAAALLALCRRPGPYRQMAWAAAAAVVLLAAISAFWLNRDSKTASHAAAPGNVVGTVDPYLAVVVSQTPEARWAGTNAPRGLGHAVGRDRYRLESGEVLLHLDNHVELLVRGPAELQLHSVEHGTVYRGEISARVPKDAIGFRMDTPGLNVIDLGTEFSLAADENGQPKVHVFQGKVRAGLPAVPATRMELVAGESARFDVAGGSSKIGPEDPSLFPALGDEAGLPRTTGDVRFLWQAPKAVTDGTFEHDYIIAFEEQAEVTLPKPISVIRGISFQQDGAEPSKAERVTLPAGTRVRSYYVHFDNVGRGVREVESKGSITFDQPVLGLVIPNTALKTTDSWLARADTAYETNLNRTLEMRFMGSKTYKPDPNISGRYDEVHLGEDGRTVTMDLLSSWSVDQFRILVAVEEK